MMGVGKQGNGVIIARFYHLFSSWKMQIDWEFRGVGLRLAALGFDTAVCLVSPGISE